MSPEPGPLPLCLWVSPVAETGGVARHVVDVARAGIPGFRLAVLCPGGSLARELREVGAAVLTGAFGPRAAADPRAAAAVSVATLRRAVRTLRPAIVHSHLAYADVIAAAVVTGLPAPGLPGPAGLRVRPRLVSTEHGIADDAALYRPGPVRTRAATAVHRSRLRRTDAAIAVSRATARVMARRWGARGVVVIPNGIDRDAFVTPQPAPGRGPRILSLTRLSPEKGLTEVMRAVDELRRRYPGASLTLAGEGPQRSELEALVRRAGLSDVVRMPGTVNAREALAEHDVVVQLSRWENCSYTLLDAAAAGLGVVATDVGGNAEILPPRCLVPLDHDRLPHVVARAIAEQLIPRNRPGLSPAWPTVARMTERIARVYREVCA